MSDIGPVETKVEQELARWFDLAEAWDAVLLVGEADIFLEQRKGRDLARNGLVTGESLCCSIQTTSAEHVTSFSPTHGILQGSTFPDYK